MPWMHFALFHQCPAVAAGKINSFLILGLTFVLAASHICSKLNDYDNGLHVKYQVYVNSLWGDKIAFISWKSELNYTKCRI